MADTLTPAMVQAGVAAYTHGLGVYDIAEIVEDIYLAMNAARTIDDAPTRPPHPERVPGTGKENGLGVTGLPKVCADAPDARDDVERVAMVIAAKAGAIWPQDAGRYRGYAEAAIAALCPKPTEAAQ